MPLVSESLFKNVTAEVQKAIAKVWTLIAKIQGVSQATFRVIGEDPSS